MEVYIYCPKAKPYLLKIKSEEVDFMCNYKQWLIDNDNIYKKMAYNGTIVASFDLNKIEKMGLDTNKGLEFVNNFNKESQLTLEKIANYVGDGYYYAWHIDNLKILDKPLELKDSILDNSSYFYTKKIIGNMVIHKALTKAPQSWCYAYDNKDNKCILISIKPEWLCKILNGEKNIEVRKTAPKEILLCQKD